MLGERRRLERPRPNPPPYLPDVELDPHAPLAAPPLPYELPPSYSRPSNRANEVNEAMDVYMQKKPSRLKAGLMNLLTGLGQGLAGGDLAQGLGGAIGGFAGGVINPKGVREREFEQKIKPQIQERWGIEDAERGMQRQAGIDAMNAAKTAAEIGALNRSNIPKPPPRRSPIRSDRGLYDQETGQIIPGTEPLPPPQKELAPSWHRDEKGRFVNLNDPANKGKVIRGYERPRVAAAPKAEKKVIGISKVRASAEAGGMAVDEAAARFRAQGYTIDKSR